MRLTRYCGGRELGESTPQALIDGTHTAQVGGVGGPSSSLLCCVFARGRRLHLAGWRTKGATLRYPNGMTRALCYDADAPTDWQRLQEAARALAACGYATLLEASPVGHGGHLWIIYSDLVVAAWAQRSAVAHAPVLQEIGEYWPSAAHKIRLPGGKYVQPGFAAWCTLADAAGTVLATDGASAARVLLDFQTPATVVPASPVAMSLAL